MSSTTLGYDLPLSVSLRGGGDVLIWPDHVPLRMEIYPLIELMRAAIIPDVVTVNVDVPRSGLALALPFQLHDGHASLFVPLDPLDASRMFWLILQQQPKLRTYENTNKSSDQPIMAPLRSSASQCVEKGYSNYRAVTHGNIAAIDHVLVGFAQPRGFFKPLLLPLILWFAMRCGSLHASPAAQQAFFYHVLVLAMAAMVIIPV